LLPWFLGWFSAFYGIVALLGFAFMLWRTLQFRNAHKNRDAAARKMFLATVLYLPPILIALVLAVK
jgi:heme O synthase-like polyprenyltransferase